MPTPPVRAALILVALALLRGSAALATSVNGQVTNASSQGVVNVNLDFIDRVTGVNIPLSNDSTDVLGFYAVTVPAGLYNVRFKPPLGTHYVGVELQAVTVQGTSMVLNQTLQTGWIISGKIVDDLSAPVASVDLDVIAAATGITVYTNHDVSDSLGNFNVVVPAGTYQVRFNPPAGSSLVAVKLDGLVITSDKALGNVVLPHGFHLSGDVRAPDGSAVTNAAARVLDPAMGAEVLTPNNRTDSAGHFDVVVLAGIYNLRIDPARGAAVVPRTVYAVTVTADRLIPAATLDAGMIVSGTVVDGAGNKIRGIDLDFFNAFSGTKQFTPHDSTGDNGDFVVTVRPGTYDITFDPQSLPGLAPQSRPGVPVSGNLTLPTITLPPGFVVSGTVRDAPANPAAGVDLDFIDRTSGQTIFTPRDSTDAAGDFAVVVSAATYEVDFTPPDGSGSGQTSVPQITVAANVALGTVTLPPAFPAIPQAISPDSGDALGGTPVSVTGSGFAPGAVVTLGGVALAQMVRLDATTIQGVSRPRPPGVVDVQVINPGAAAAALPGAFTYRPPAIDAALTVAPTGPLGNDLLLTWSGTGQQRYTIYRSSSPARFTDLERVEVIGGTTFLDEGALARPGNLFYMVQ